jgi:hypothetical protein
MVTRRACSSSIFHRRHARDGTRAPNEGWDEILILGEEDMDAVVEIVEH